MKLSAKTISVNWSSFNVNVKRSWVFDFNKILELRICVKRRSKLILTAKKPFIIKSVAYLTLRLITLFKSQ